MWGVCVQEATGGRRLIRDALSRTLLLLLFLLLMLEEHQSVVAGIVSLVLRKRFFWGLVVITS